MLASGNTVRRRAPSGNLRSPISTDRVPVGTLAGCPKNELCEIPTVLGRPRDTHDATVTALGPSPVPRWVDHGPCGRLESTQHLLDVVATVAWARRHERSVSSRPSGQAEPIPLTNTGASAIRIHGRADSSAADGSAGCSSMASESMKVPRRRASRFDRSAGS